MQDIEISGAGTTIVNGTYTYMGQYTSNGHSADYYQKGSIYIYRLSIKVYPWEPIRHWWRIGSSLGSNSHSQLYYSVESSQTYINGLTFSIVSGLGTSPLPDATISISTNNWDGSSWSSGSAPGPSDDVTLSSSGSPGSFGAQNLQLEPGVDLTISSGDTVTVSGDISGESPVNLDGNLTNFSLSGSSSNWVSGAGSTFAGSGSPANGLNFDGSGDYIRLDSAIIGSRTTFTIELWINPSQNNATGAIYGEYAVGTSNTANFLFLNSGKIAFDQYTPSGNVFSINSALSAGTWYHIAYVRDGSQQTLYVNSTAGTDNNAETYVGNSTDKFQIGARYQGSSNGTYLDATIDELRFWNTARTQTELQNNKNNELNGNEAGLLAYFNFNQGTDGGSNSGVTELINNKITSYDTNVITGNGALIFDNNGETLNLSNVKLNMEGVLQVVSGTTLQTNESLTLTASSASSYGQIIGDGTVLGNVTSQAWMDVSSARYHYLGSPFTNATLEEFNEGQSMVAVNSNQGTVWQWNANTASWEAPSSLSGVATNGRGYAMYAGTNAYGTYLMNGNGVSELDGTVASGDIAVALGYNNGQSAGVSFAGGTGQSSTEGWNFLANPYPSQYDWNGQSLPTGMSNAFYVNTGSGYASYVSGVGTNGGTQYLAPFQGFWVQTSNASPGNFTFEQDQRVTAPSTNLMKASPIDGVWLTVSDSTNSDELFIGFDKQATIGFDASLDARKLLNKNEIPNLYTTSNGEAFSINRIAPASQTSFPLTLDNVVESRQLSLALNADQLSSYDAVVLEDKMLNVMHDLQASDYSFMHSESYGSNRFVVHFSSMAVNNPELSTLKGWYAYASEHGIEVQLGELRDATIEVYDLGGRIIHHLEHQEGVALIPTNQTRQLYVVKVTSSSASSVQKIIR